MNDFVKKQYEDLQEELDLYLTLGVLPVKKISGALGSIRDSLARLKKYIRERPFKDEKEEIAFFKYHKPKFLAEQIYALEILTIEMNRPAFGEAAIKDFFEAELGDIRRFFGKYKLLYQYYRLDESYLDSILFLRGAAPASILLPEAPDLDPVFSTFGDFPFGKFIALERLQEWLVGELRVADYRSASSDGAKIVAGEDTGRALATNNAIGAFSGPVSLRWTGQTVNLVELAYGIWLTGQVNNGNASISEIVEWMELAFRVKIGKAHRRWQSIASRKRLGYTKYIDQIKLVLEKRIEEELSR